MHTLLFKINSIAGKAISKKKLKKYYRKFLKISYKALSYLKKELGVMKERAARLDVKPSNREMLDALFEQIDDDLEDGGHVLFYSENRVMNGVNLPAVEKVSAISGGDSAYIKKGPRPAKIGYKPQIRRSGNGFSLFAGLRKGMPPIRRNLSLHLALQLKTLRWFPLW